MSAAIKAARMNHQMVRSGYRGDPGLFSFIGKAIKSVGKLIPGVSTAINLVEGAGSLLAGNGKPKNPSIALKPLPASLAPQTNNQFGLVNIGQAPPPMIGPGGNTTQGGTSGGTDWNSSSSETGHTACRSGYHYNKTGYFTKRYGFIAKGTVCVKNRKRNPLNPRALSRSLARISSAKSAVRFLAGVEVPKRCRRR